MQKLTKKQYKDRQRVLAWLRDEPFKESSRSSPMVPALTVEDVFEQYSPPDITGAGQFFTPLEMANVLVGSMSFPRYQPEGVRVLDPCAGIGHLLYPLVDCGFDFNFVAYELEEECVEIGRKLFPNVEWHWKIPFDCLADVEGQFDFVVMNPPFGTRRGMAPGERMCEGRCTKSEHVFFELAVCALRPGGQLGVIGPWNYHQKMPKALTKWRDERVVLEVDMGEIKGEFAHSGICVHGYVYRKKEDPTTEWVYEVNKKGRELDEMASTIHSQDSDIQAGIEKWKELAAGGPKARQLTLPF